MSTGTIRFLRDGENGRKGVWRWGEREIIYLSLHCHHQNNSCIKMGSDESHFIVSLIVRDKVTRQCPQTTTRERRAEAESSRGPSAYLPNALPVGQTGSRTWYIFHLNYLYHSPDKVKVGILESPRVSVRLPALKFRRFC